MEHNLKWLWQSWGACLDLETVQIFLDLGCCPNDIVREALLTKRYDLVFMLADKGADMQSIYLPDIPGEPWQTARRVLPLIDTPEKRKSLKEIFVAIANHALFLGCES